MKNLNRTGFNRSIISWLRHVLADFSCFLVPRIPWENVSSSSFSNSQSFNETFE